MSATQEILPGDTLKRITAEHWHMDEFVEWMKRRLDLDKKYTEDLKALGMLANPEWSQSSVSTLVSPMAELITREIEERQATCDAMNTYLKELSKANSPDHDVETGGSMISKYDQLIIGCKFLEVCREEASSTKAVKDMQRWHVKGTNSKNIIDMGDEDLHRFVLPETERNYRESVVRQQALARVINPWHHNQLPELLESHQSRSEEIKTLMARMVSEHSRLLTALVGHLEATKNQVHGFSSSSFISLAHIRHDYESEHEYMKEAVHVDFSNGTMRSHVIFGTVSQTPLEVRRAMNLLEGRNVDWLYQGRLDNDKGFELEQSSATLPSLQLQTLSDDELKLLCSFGLLSNPPLIPLDEEEIKRYANGISRKNLHIIMSRLAKQDEIAVPLDILHWYNVYTLPKLMTHREDSRKIVEDIYRKWDFSNHRPFPPGVTRELK